MLQSRIKICSVCLGVQGYSLCLDPRGLLFPCFATGNTFPGKWAGCWMSSMNTEKKIHWGVEGGHAIHLTRKRRFQLLWRWGRVVAGEHCPEIQETEQGEDQLAVSKKTDPN